MDYSCTTRMNKSENTKKRSSWGGNLGSTEYNEYNIMNRNTQLALCILNLAKLQNCYTKNRTHKIVTKNRIVKTYLKTEICHWRNPCCHPLDKDTKLKWVHCASNRLIAYLKISYFLHPPLQTKQTSNSFSLFCFLKKLMILHYSSINCVKHTRHRMYIWDIFHQVYIIKIIYDSHNFYIVLYMGHYLYPCHWPVMTVYKLLALIYPIIKMKYHCCLWLNILCIVFKHLYDTQKFILLLWTGDLCID